ncbi:MAG: DUF2975 domain-containing protein [Candidatus Cyclobacteriaceae bacterium M2_1C_046]
MKQLTTLSVLAKWIINITLAAVIIIIFMNLIHGYKLMQDNIKTPSTEGVLDWSKSSSINFNGYSLKHVLEYEKDENGTYKANFQDYILLRTPTPRIAINNIEGEQFSLIGENERITAYLQNESSPIVYKIKEKQAQKNVIIVGVLTNVFILLILLLWLLVFRKFIISISRKEFFIIKNARRLIILSIPAFILPFFNYLISYLSNQFYIKNFTAVQGHLLINYHFDPVPIIFGMTFLIMAGVVYEGARLKEETDLTI